MKQFQQIFLICFLSATAFAQRYNSFDSTYDYADEEGIEDHAVLPKFLATPQTFSVAIGDEITLPCDVDNSGKSNITYQLLFKFKSKKEDRMIYVGDIKIRHRSKIRKVGNTFVIPNVRKTDAGEYNCRIEAESIVQISHTLNVQYPAQVLRVSDEVQKVVQGSSVSLACRAEGNPTPAITWSKKNGHLPSGQKSEEGVSITFEEVDRHVEGTYICTAANGIGNPSSTGITIEVEYKPEIISEQAIMNTGDEYQAALVCMVHGRPTPEVKWYRGRSPVASEKHVMTHDGAHRHALTISRVTDSDFGEYTCKAKNKYGEEESMLYLTGNVSTGK